LESCVTNFSIWDFQTSLSSNITPRYFKLRNEKRDLGKGEGDLRKKFSYSDVFKFSVWQNRWCFYLFTVLFRINFGNFVEFLSTNLDCPGQVEVSAGAKNQETEFLGRTFSFPCYTVSRGFMNLIDSLCLNLQKVDQEAKQVRRSAHHSSYLPQVPLPISKTTSKPRYTGANKSLDT